ncbi:MAG TPA: hypothetical protein VLB69_05410 [Rudaea sp.]|nr:hypothetical protein [Rudaea sp.]
MLSSGYSPHAAHRTAPADDMAPWITALSCWLILGCAALLCVPVLRGTDPLFGWLPFWLVVAPAIDLAVLRRRSLIARTRNLVARVGRRRTARQARPLRRRQRTVRRAPRTRTAAR